MVYYAIAYLCHSRHAKQKIFISSNIYPHSEKKEKTQHSIQNGFDVPALNRLFNNLNCLQLKKKRTAINLLDRRLMSQQLAAKAVSIASIATVKYVRATMLEMDWKHTGMPDNSNSHSFFFRMFLSRKMIYSPQIIIALSVRITAIRLEWLSALRQSSAG